MRCVVLVTEVSGNEMFYFAGRCYTLASEEEQKRHPALGFGQVLAYQHPSRVPVSFGTHIRVIVEK